MDERQIREELRRIVVNLGDALRQPMTPREWYIAIRRVVHGLLALGDKHFGVERPVPPK